MAINLCLNSLRGVLFFREAYDIVWSRDLNRVDRVIRAVTLVVWAFSGINRRYCVKIVELTLRGITIIRSRRISADLCSMARRGIEAFLPSFNITALAINSVEVIWRFDLISRIKRMIRTWFPQYSVPLHRLTFDPNTQKRSMLFLQLMTIPEVFDIDPFLNSRRCPITQGMISMPVEDPATGHLYEYEALAKWFEVSNTYPLTRRPVMRMADKPRLTGIFESRDHILFWHYICNRIGVPFPYEREFNEEEKVAFYRKIKEQLDREPPEIFVSRFAEEFPDDVIDLPFFDEIAVCPITNKAIRYPVNFRGDDVLYEKNALLRSLDKFPGKTVEDIVNNDWFLKRTNVYVYMLGKKYRKFWEMMQKVFIERPELIV